MARRLRAQAAVDFMMSYGIALVIVFIAVSIIFKVSLTTPVFVGSLCTSAPGFECETYTISASSGILYLTLSQATGGTIVINGEACASQPNGIGSYPAYGNINVNSLAAYYPPSNGPGTGATVYSDNSNTMQMYCYTNTGVATGQFGTSFTGFVWLNYTVPSYGTVTQQVAILNLKYT